MNLQTLRIGIDVGSASHRVAVGLPDGKLIDEFDIEHHVQGFSPRRAQSLLRRM